MTLSAKDAKDIENRLLRLESKVEKLSGETDHAKREYVTILGIFAAIVMAFTAGIAFSSSALENIGQASPAKLGLVLIPMAWFLLNMIAMLIYFLASIAKAELDAADKMLKTMNWILLGGFALVLLYVIVFNLL